MRRRPEWPHQLPAEGAEEVRHVSPLEPDRPGDADDVQSARIEERTGLDEAVLAELQRLSRPKGGATHALALLVVSVVAYSALGSLSSPLQTVAIIVGVLLVHELGHLVAMLAFGYRDVKMFFIPFFGAAVSGEHLTVSGHKRAIVALLGPFPGIVIGIVLAVAGVGGNEFALSVASMALLINAFNLLPLYPLDGGRFLQEILFCRNRYAEVVFKFLAGVAIVLLGFASDSWIFMVFGGFVAIGSLHTYRLAGIARDALVTGEYPGQGGPIEASPEAASQLIPQVRKAFPAAGSAKTVAELVKGVWERMHARPPGVVATALLLSVYVGFWSVATYVGVKAWAAYEVQSMDEAPVSMDLEEQ
jgi:Zn-dependent protease